MATGESTALLQFSFYAGNILRWAIHAQHCDDAVQLALQSGHWLSVHYLRLTFPFQSQLPAFNNSSQILGLDFAFTLSGSEHISQIYYLL